MHTKTITTIIPTYNRERFITKAIESVIKQTIKVDEIIVIDDGSNDNTENIIKKYNVKYIKQNNSGVSSARNLGIKNASGDLITFLDSDDMWIDTKIEKQLHYHLKNPHIKFSHTNEKWIREDKQLPIKGKNTKFGGFIFNQILETCTIGCSTVMIHKDIFDDVGMFDESFEVCEDYDLWLRIAKNYEIGFINEELTTKYAGDWEQLSFKYWGMDRWRIKALQKHSQNKNNDVIAQIIKKANLLVKGAKKRENSAILAEYSALIEKYNNI